MDLQNTRHITSLEMSQALRDHGLPKSQTLFAWVRLNTEEDYKIMGREEITNRHSAGETDDIVDAYTSSEIVDILAGMGNWTTVSKDNSRYDIKFLGKSQGMIKMQDVGDEAEGRAGILKLMLDQGILSVKAEGK